MKLERTTALSALESAVLNYSLHRAGKGELEPEDRAGVESALQSLGSDMFVSSGIAARPSIYRVGRLFNKYEIYFSPKVATQAADLTTAKIIAIGRSSQVARCPIVLGDAVAPTFLDLNMQSDLKRNAAMYARDFTVVNPHEPSALGCAEITLTNLG